MDQALVKNAAEAELSENWENGRWGGAFREHERGLKCYLAAVELSKAEHGPSAKMNPRNSRILLTMVDLQFTKPALPLRKSDQTLHSVAMSNISPVAVLCFPAPVRHNHGCCWETFYIFAYCVLVGNPNLTAKF